MATQKAQRIGIWIIAIVLTVGTLAGFIAIVLEPKNQATDQAKLSALQAQYKAAQDAQDAELSAKYFTDLNQYSSRVGVFNKDEVTELRTEDLKIGDGPDITAESSFSAYYIGWNPDGVIFDSSIKDGKLIAPIAVQPGNVIDGWTEGAVGMKVGGIRELTIPSAKAYGATAKSDAIPANTPLKFVMFIIPTPDPVAIPPELLKYYTNGGRL